MAGSYLEQFLESIQTLPCDLARNLTLIYDLDCKVDVFVESAEEMSCMYIKNSHHLKPGEKKASYEKIMELMDKAQLLSEDKKELAHQIYNMVDKHIRRLDTELAKFDKELEKERNAEDGTGKSKKRRPKSNAKEQKSTENVVNKTDLDDASTNKKDHPIKNETTHTPANDASGKNNISENNKVTSPEILDMEVDPNEPLYCICHQVSFGEMVGCDDTDCPIEWFHFQCVGLTAKPKGKWYCPQCSIKRKN